MAGVTKTNDINVAVRELDFSTSFASNWTALRDIMGITRPIRKTAGTKLTAKRGSVVLESGSVSEGETIPLSKASVEEVEFGTMELTKYRKGVTVEAITKYGYDVACAKTDEALKNKIISNITRDFYNFAGSGTLTAIQTTFQLALAMAKGYVINKFKAMNKDAGNVVAFCNVLDFYDYIGTAEITVQTLNGITYVKDFMGYTAILLEDSTRIPRGKVFATPSENIVNYYIDPSDADYNKAGFDFTTDSETGLIGSHIVVDYTNFTSVNNVLYGINLFAEYIDGIAVITIEASGSLGSITATSAAATDTTGGTKITITAPSTIPADWKLYFKADASTAPFITYKQSIDDTWTPLTLTNGVADNVKPTGLASADKATVVAVNGAGQAVASGTIASITVK